ncbi:MAG: hypothetical protein JNJ55_11600 [Betaproteobacteria bacterium]|nr:hypothetical protein [Betaproteobacteria bacterium]
MYAVVLALAVFATIGSQYAFLVACLGIPGALIWIFRIVVVHRHRPQAAKRLSIFGAFVLFAVGPASCTIQTRLLEHRLEAVIAALESHRSTHGQYPKSLKELRPPLDADCSPRFPRPANYFASNGNTEFSLTCVNYGMNKHTYSSVTRKWRDWD